MSSEPYHRVRAGGLTLLLFAGCIHMPAAASESAPAARESAAVTVGPNDPVITLEGFCSEPTGTADACRTVITRAQFEKLIDALQPDMPPSLKLKVANAYARNLRMAAAAKKRGLDKTPQFQEEMRFARMQLLAQDLTRLLQAQSSQISAAELADFYRKNQSSFEQATVARIFIPPATEKMPDEAMAQFAAALRERAVKGGDPDALQLEAYAAAGSPKARVDTKLENVRRASLPPRHESVLSLRPGKVSVVFADPGGARYIYKVIDKRTLTAEQAAAEIRTAIAAQRYRESTQEFQGVVVFSDGYFQSAGKQAERAEQIGGENGGQ
jgi:hypothetical protein